MEASSHDEAISLMGLLGLINREKRYIAQLKREGKAFEHRETILKQLEAKIADG